MTPSRFRGLAADGDIDIDAVCKALQEKQDVCEAVLLLFLSPYWRKQESERWHELTGHREATVAKLCEYVESITTKDE